MSKIEALLDSNVIIASLAEIHAHHIPSLNLLRNSGKTKFAVAAHSYAEAYSTLTRKGDRAPFQFSPADASAALETVRAVTSLVGLTAAQTFDAVRSFARENGNGARLYDRLIGEAAVIHAIPQIITWNISHMASLFPALLVATPEQFLTAAAARGG